MANLIPVEHDPFDMAGTLAWQRGVDTAQGFDRQAPEPMPGTDRAYDLMLAMGRAGGDLRKNAPLLWETAPGRMAQGLARFASGGTPAASPGLRREDYTDDPAAKQPVEPMIHDAMNVADVMSLGGMPMAKAGAAGIFGGRLAVTADHQALNRAEALAKAGAPKEQIWSETGWFKGADDKWRFEIPDATSHAKEFQPGYFSANQALSHLNLYRAYPDTKGVLVGLQHPDMMGGLKGKYTPPEDRGRSGLSNIREEVQSQATIPSDVRETLLHEFQHAVQQREGFTPGGMPQNFGKEQRELFDNAWTVRNRMDHLGESPEVAAKYIADSSGHDPKQLQQLAEQFTGTELRKKMDGAAPFEQYRRLAGEVEARNVQTRMDMTPEQRRAKPPWETEDVPIGQQIVRGLEGRADGGPVAPGQSYIVGENGPEVFTPNERGAIIPPAVAASIQSRLIPVDHDPFEGN